MFKNKSADGKLNMCGGNISVLRKKMKISQRELASQLQLLDVDITKNAIQQIESGERFVIDLELKGFSQFFGVSVDDLLK